MNKYTIDIIQFDVRDNVTKALVYLTATPDSEQEFIDRINGWHCMTFPGNALTTHQIFVGMFKGPNAFGYTNWPKCPAPELPQ